MTQKSILPKQLLKLKFSSDNTVLMFFSAVIGFLLIFIIGFLYFKLFSAKDVSAFLPQGDTLLYAEMKYGAESDALGVKRHQVQQFLEDYFNVDYEKDISPWLGEKVVFALVRDEDILQDVVFLEAGDKDATRTFFQKLGIENEVLEVKHYRRMPVYFFPFSRTYYFTFLNKYVVVSTHEGNIRRIIDIYHEEKNTLKEDAHYVKVVNNLPKNSSVFTYADLKGLTDASLFVSQYSYIFDVLTHAGFSANGKKDYLNIKGLALLDKDVLGTESYFSRVPKFDGKLRSWVPNENIVFYAGGYDFSTQMRETMKLFQSFNPSFALIVEGILKKQKENVLGTKVNLEEDIFPLFPKEYAFYVDSLADYIKMTIIAEQEEEVLVEVEETMGKILQGFKDQMLYLAPTIRTRELPDGSIYTELVADEDKMQSVEEDYQGYKIYGVEIRESPYSLYYSIIGEKLVVSTWMKGITDVVDTMKGGKKSLFIDEKFSKLMKKMSLTGNELTYMDLSFIKNVLPENMATYVDFDKLNYAAVVKKYFEDGVSVEISVGK